MVMHLWGKFFMAAWRGRRALTWMTGVVAFVASIGTAFTGYLSQTNFDAQWISTQAKDGVVVRSCREEVAVRGAVAPSARLLPGLRWPGRPATPP